MTTFLPLFDTMTAPLLETAAAATTPGVDSTSEREDDEDCENSFPSPKHTHPFDDSLHSNHPLHASSV